MKRFVRPVCMAVLLTECCVIDDGGHLSGTTQVGIKPNQLEVNGGLVTPVCKVGDPFCTNDYRPIAVTDPMMRLHADILNDRLANFVQTLGMGLDQAHLFSLQGLLPFSLLLTRLRQMAST